MKILSFLFALLFPVINLFAQTAAASLGASRSIPSNLWGLNGQNVFRDNVFWTTPELLKSLRALQPQVLRYPGTQGNWWNWRTGGFINAEDFPKDYEKIDQGPNKPADFKLAVDATGATPIWMLNMISTPFEEQLEMLRYVKGLGMSVELIELGSEFYLEGNKLVQKLYPTPADYAREANQRRDSIKKYFPEAKCAFIGALTKGNKPSRRNSWNEGLAPAMKNPDAITLHVYPMQSMAKATPQQKGDPLEVLSEPFRAMDRIMKKEMTYFPKNSEIWITEYNMDNNTAPVHGTWMHGIWAVLMSMKFLEEPRVTHTVFHAMIGTAGYGAIFSNNHGFKLGKNGEFVPPANPPETKPFGFSATGTTLAIYGDVLKGKTSATPIRFDNIPQMRCGTDGYSYPAVYGWKFSNASSSELIILNLSDKAVSIETSKICSATSRYHQQYAEAYTYIAKGNEFKSEEGSVSGTLSLKPYSIVRVTGR